MLNQRTLNVLICVACGGDLTTEGGRFTCDKCGHFYSTVEGAPVLIGERGEAVNQGGPDVLINKLKVFFKRFPWFFKILLYTFGPSFVGKSAKQAIADLGPEKLILNVGSGVIVVRTDVVNVDFYPFANVQIVADATCLPFKDNSVDAVICESLLEHVPDPGRVVGEIKRVLKPGGFFYLTIPFLAPFHSSPHDYQRLSREGIRVLCQEFDEQESGVRQGPTSALVLVAVDWLATVLSFGVPIFQQAWVIVLTILTCPVKLLDFFIYRFKTAENIAYGFYYLGRKK